MSSMFGGGFKATKCKTLLRLAMSRIKLLRNKRDISVKQMRKDIAQLLQTGQEPSARIRVEHIAREQNIMAAYDILELFCELIIVRLPIIEAQKVCPADLKEAISSVIFASPRCADLPELLQIRTLFTTKYGKEFVAAAAELRPECGVNRRIIEKLSVRAPPGEAKLKLLKEIAAEYKVDWDPADTEAELLKRPEDLLDGPKQFYGASSAPLPDAPLVSNSASVKDSSSFPQRASNAPPQPPHPPPSAPSPPSAPGPIQMLPLDQSSSDEDHPPQTASSIRKPQFLPFTAPPPSKRVPADSPPKSSVSRPATTNTSSTEGNYESKKSVSKADSYSQSRKESRGDHRKPVNYENVAAAAQAAAESANRAVAAARAAAQLAKKEESSPSPPRSRRASLQPKSDSDDEDSGGEAPFLLYERRRNSSKSTGEPLKHERRESLPKRSDTEIRSSGASLNRQNVGEEQEFSFRLTTQEDPKASISKRSNSEDRDESSHWRSISDERLEDSNRRSKSDDRKGRIRRSDSDDRQEVLFRRTSSGDRADEQQESTSWKRGAERRAEYDVEPPQKIDPEKESFWKTPETLRSGSDSISKKIDAGIFTGQADEDDIDYQRKSSNSKMNEHGRYGDASNIFSRTDSAESNLFKRSDSAEVDLRSSDESFYDTKPGFATPKFDDEEYSASHRNLRVSSIHDEDSYKRNSSTAKVSSPTLKPSFNDFWRTESLSHRTPEEDELFVKKFSFSGREDVKPLEKAKSDTLFETAAENSFAASAESIDRAGSDPLYTRSLIGDETRPLKQEPTIPSKSRRTRGNSILLNRDTSDDVSSPVRRSRTYSQDSQSRSQNSSTFDDAASPPVKHSVSYKSTPSVNSSAYHSPETQRESSPPSILTGSASGSANTSPGSVHPKLPDIDDLTARFEALKAAKR
ncbi:vacuolar protein sorting-associated protein IST1 [Marchantia polymorpha subsp. ruderalis]|uniref:IST1-like protein n=2 Tax=Marchantia polymorpha TaxID=3197 RepID=A0AAF6AYX3_MARPO|nr:hypothetical protein MARPO_0105s0005 [Marchantia polymorpha]BBN04957.1 hypothetical protein Mp_3g09120 [Marchantia polymorpha subsp. ruderalis]|eukprot:PTQ31886.1 hypothetical protein MARPO_0105s0005 [Marchantia polymorpha]